METGNNNVEKKTEGEVNQNDRYISTDSTNEEIKEDRTESKPKITIEKGKKPIDFDDLFF